MTTAPLLEGVAELLGELGAPETFSSQRTAPAADLHLEVKGVGRIRFPVSRRQAEMLCGVGRPAPYGRGEKTLVDPKVRDTWEIPKSRVKIDRRRWKKTLAPMLDKLRDDLGLLGGGRLQAELHSLLVYAPGQFFLPHQDSEKNDEMIGTLVVTLPSSFSGGELIVEHQGEKATYRGSRKLLSFVALYADCRHEVRPVKAGYRISLTYNLILKADESMAVPSRLEPSPKTTEELTHLLGEYFTTPMPPRYDWEADDPPRDPPSRLVYLLDHEYTERGLGWERLKGNDTARAVALRRAAEREDCEVALALAKVHENWTCFEEDRSSRWDRYRSWTRDEDEEWLEDGLAFANLGPDRYELGELIDSEIELTHWLDASGKKARSVDTYVSEEETCSTTPSVELEPYAAEYEGFMGNYGNTMDRWYRRAAIVLWPRRRAFAVRGEVSPAWALHTLEEELRSGEISGAREKAASLLSFWEDAVCRVAERDFLAQALRVAEGLDDREVATSLLSPFFLRELTPKEVDDFVALAVRYGEKWASEALSEPVAYDSLGRSEALERLEDLPLLYEALCAAEETVGTRCAELLSRRRWGLLREKIEQVLNVEAPSRRSEAAKGLPGPILGFLGGAELISADDLCDEVVAFLCAAGHEILVLTLVQVLQLAVATTPEMLDLPSLDAIRRHAVERLEAWLEEPARREGDWSIELPDGCNCGLCVTLGKFLADPEEQVLEWPIAKQKRMHVHRRLDAHELPVRHETRRSGSPYTLVLKKTKALFEKEARRRRRLEDDLQWLTELSEAVPQE